MVRSSPSIAHQIPGKTPGRGPGPALRFGMPPPKRHDRVLILIALFKFVKAALLLAVGLGAVGLLHAGLARESQRLLHVFSSGAERRITQAALSRVSGLSPKRIEALGIGAFLYAVLFTVEGVGLWLEKRWAEFLTVIATASFIPFEIYELARDVTATRIVALVINVAVVVYLIVRLVRRHRRG